MHLLHLWSLKNFKKINKLAKRIRVNLRVMTSWLMFDRVSANSVTKIYTQIWKSFYNFRLILLLLNNFITSTKVIRKFQKRWWVCQNYNDYSKKYPNTQLVTEINLISKVQRSFPSSDFLFSHPTRASVGSGIRGWNIHSHSKSEFW